MAADTPKSLRNAVIYSVFARNHTEEGTLEAERLAFDFDAEEPALLFAAWDFSPFVFGSISSQVVPIIRITSSLEMSAL